MEAGKQRGEWEWLSRPDKKLHPEPAMGWVKDNQIYAIEYIVSCSNKAQEFTLTVTSGDEGDLDKDMVEKQL